MTLALFGFTKLSLSQSFSYDYIVQRADSIMVAKVGSQVFKNNYKQDTEIRYSYEKKNKTLLLGKLKKGETTKGKLIDAQIIYVFSLNVDISFTPTLTYIKFDSSLNLQVTPNTEFIPKCILENNSCIIIPKQKAIDIAKTSFKEKILKPISAHFGYLASANKYIWTVINDLGDDVSEDIRIDALTGEVVDYFKGAHVILH